MSTSNNGDIKRRDRHDIVVEILKTAVEGRIKTHIMYKAKLSYAQLNEYLPMLIERGFLENTSIRHKRVLKRVYKTTEKGQRFLENFDSIKKLWSYPTNSSV
ncbi:MAG TPA: winged helix-turn-helix domain-containing protein [Candidatus Bathyarchaeia archaeon]|nr:winged helix-turn-helix domain-containing protein [Candidatus Bathyarchaeia archaeon]